MENPGRPHPYHHPNRLPNLANPRFVDRVSTPAAVVVTPVDEQSRVTALLADALRAVALTAAPFPGCGLYVWPGRHERIAECWPPECGVAGVTHQMSDFRLALRGPLDHGG